MLTDAQRELLEDKFVLWDKASRTYGTGPDADMSRDYNRRAAEALKAALAICSEAPFSTSPADAGREADVTATGGSADPGGAPTVSDEP